MQAAWLRLPVASLLLLEANLVRLQSLDLLQDIGWLSCQLSGYRWGAPTLATATHLLRHSKLVYAALAARHPHPLA